MHVKAVRVFVDCVLRYGLPIKFVAVLVRGSPKNKPLLMEAVKAAFLSGQIQATKSGLAVAMSKSLRSRGITISECTVVRWLEKT
jgi:hypothetical protein